MWQRERSKEEIKELRRKSAEFRKSMEPALEEAIKIAGLDKKKRSTMEDVRKAMEAAEARRGGVV